MPLVSPPVVDLQWWGNASTSFGIRIALGCLEVGTRVQGWSKAGVWHQLGPSCGSGTQITTGNPPTSYCQHQPLQLAIPSTIRQCWCCTSNKQRTVMQPWDEQNSQAHIFTSGPSPVENSTCCQLWQHFQCSLLRRHWQLPAWFSSSQYSCVIPFTWWSFRQINLTLMPAFIDSSISPTTLPTVSLSSPLQPNLSLLHPHCRAEEWIFLWKGVNNLPASTIINPTIQLIAALATHASLHKTSSYGQAFANSIYSVISLL